MANKQLKTLTPAQYAFVRWLYATHPQMAKAAEERHASISGFMDTFNNVFDNVMQKAPDLLNQYVKGKQEIEALKINLQRAKEGQFPIDAQGNLYNAGAVAPAQPAWMVPALVVGGGLILYLLLARR